MSSPFRGYIGHTQVEQKGVECTSGLGWGGGVLHSESDVKVAKEKIDSFQDSTVTPVEVVVMVIGVTQV